MFYTYFSGRDTIKISNEIQNTVKEVNKQVEQVSGETKQNTEMLMKVKEGIQCVESAVSTSSEALETIQQKDFSEQEKQVAIHNIERTRNSMQMFLEKMKEND